MSTPSTESPVVAAAAAPAQDLDLIDRLNDASKRAVEVVNKFANIEPPTNDEFDSCPDSNPWKNPALIEKELSVARDELNQAWVDLKEKKDREQIKVDPNEFVDNYVEEGKESYEAEQLSEEQFRVMYMDMITDAFGDVLENMKNKGEDNEDNVDILVDCLQTGIDFMEETDGVHTVDNGDGTTKKTYTSRYFDNLDYHYEQEQKKKESDSDDEDDEEMKDDDDDTDEDEDSSDDDNGGDSSLTIHQRRQKSLGYIVTGVNDDMKDEKKDDEERS